MLSLTQKGTRRNLLALFAASALAASALAQSAAKPAVPDAERLRAHVAYLASDRLEGRRTGTPGAEEAARYVAEEFRRIGLAPGGKGSIIFRSGPNEINGAFSSYLQPFPYVAGVELGGGNSLTATRRVDRTTQGPPMAIDFRVGEDWMPLGFSSNGEVEGAVVFAGYGITAADQNYDDYKGADVTDKIAVAFSGTPDGDNPHGRFTRAGEPRFKAAAARAAGAKALVIIAAEEGFKEDRLARLRYDNAGGDAGLPVVAVSRQAAWKILGVGGSLGLIELQRLAGRGANPEPKAAAGTAAPDATAGSGSGAPTAGRPPLKGTMLSIRTEVVRRNAPAANVVGVLEGSDPKLRAEVIVIGAHYDHLGRGGEGSLAGREGEVHHGADDNASGTAGLLELARLFSNERQSMRRTVVFVAFGGEEEGLLGSGFYVEHPTRPLEQTVAMINMDMVGRLRGGALNVGGVGTAAEWRGWLEEANKGYRVTLGGGRAGRAGGEASEGKETEKGRGKGEDDGGARSGGAGDGLPRAQSPGEPVPIIVTGADGRTAVTATPAERFALRLSEDGYGPSDHSSFYARRVPVLFFFTGTHDDYHKPSDTADRINYDGEALILQFVRDLVYRVQASDPRPAYAVARSEAGARSTSFRVSLGTVPSYADSSDGLKLDAVREGSPAAAAGLRAGDRIVRLAGRDVRNVYDYTQALSEMKAGQEYAVEVIRDGQRLTMKVTPAARR